ncbi:MAG: DUF4214 domain-containing protein, partial [Desulfurivibrionaceae bacterium]
MATATLTDQITALYVVYYNRTPDEAGFNFWYSAISSGAKSLNDISAAFATHPQFVIEFGGLTNQAFVEKLYTNMLGNAGDAGGVAFWTAALDSGMSKSDLVTDFVQSVLETDLDALLAADQINQAEFDAAVIRQDTLANKVIVAENFFQTLGEITNPTYGTVENPLPLSSDPAYIASQRILAGVTNDSATVDAALAIIAQADAAAGRNPALEVINGISSYNTLTLQEVAGGTTPVLLTSVDNNGCTVESGAPTTTVLADRIVANSLDLLDNAYIDGGTGYNVVEVDAIGANAHPTALLNIQEVRVQNMPNTMQFASMSEVIQFPADTVEGGVTTKGTVEITDLTLTITNTDGYQFTVVVPPGIYTAAELAAAINLVSGQQIAAVVGAEPGTNADAAQAVADAAQAVADDAKAAYNTAKAVATAAEEAWLVAQDDNYVKQATAAAARAAADAAEDAAEAAQATASAAKTTSDTLSGAASEARILADNSWATDFAEANAEAAAAQAAFTAAQAALASAQAAVLAALPDNTAVANAQAGLTAAQSALAAAVNAESQAETDVQVAVAALAAAEQDSAAEMDPQLAENVVTTQAALAEARGETVTAQAGVATAQGTLTTALIAAAVDQDDLDEAVAVLGAAQAAAGDAQDAFEDALTTVQSIHNDAEDLEATADAAELAAANAAGVYQAAHAAALAAQEVFEAANLTALSAETAAAVAYALACGGDIVDYTECGLTPEQEQLISSGGLNAAWEAAKDASAAAKAASDDAQDIADQIAALADAAAGEGNVVITTNDNTAHEIAFGGTADIADFDLDDIPGQLTYVGQPSDTERTLDLSHAYDLEKLVVTEGADVTNYLSLGMGSLNVTGIRGDATIRLEGGFTQEVNLQFSEGVGGTNGEVDIELMIGDNSSSGAILNIAHNSSALHLDSQGVSNVITAGNLGGNLGNLRITGTGALVIENDLDFSFTDGTAGVPATIDASGNTGGVSLVLTDSTAVKFIGSNSEVNGDNFTATECEAVAIISTNGLLNHFVTDDSDIVTITSLGGADVISALNGEMAIIDAAGGNNWINADGRADVTITTTDGNDTINASSTSTGDLDPVINLVEKVVVNAGAGNNSITANGLDSSNKTQKVSITTLDGNDTISATYGASVTVNAAGGSNRITTNYSDTVKVTTLDGNDTISSTNGATVTIDAAGGDNTVIATGVKSVVKTVVITTTGGNDLITADLSDGSGYSEPPDLCAADQSITINAGAGNNRICADNYELATITTLDGNDTIEASGSTVIIVNAAGGNNNILADDSGTATITTTDGNDIIQASHGGDITINAGEGGNAITAEYTSSSLNIATGAGDDVIIANYSSNVTIEAGDGANVIEVNQANASGSSSYFGTAQVDITTGNGNDTISALRNDSVTIDAGEGNNTITVNAYCIDITTSTGNDTIVVSGLDTEVPGTLDSQIFAGSPGALLNINVGTGNNTITLGSNLQIGSGTVGYGITALEGSSITGSNITLLVEYASDLRAADLTGITRVILDDNGTAGNSVEPETMLTLTDDQFLAIGAENFSVEGSIFNTHSYVKIIVQDSTSLTALDVANLPSNIDLFLEINDGATLTMTAQQLHERVAGLGVTVADDGVSDLARGKVVIQNAGLVFDPWNIDDVIADDGINYGDADYTGGSLSADFSTENTQIQRTPTASGYNRPEDEPNQDVITIDSGSTVLTQGAFSTPWSNLEIIGNADVVFTGAIDLGDDFVVDFSGLNAEVVNFTLANFQDVKQIRGNGMEATVYVK